MTRAYQAVIAVLVLSSCLTSEGGDLDAGVDITKEGSPSTTVPPRALADRDAVVSSREACVRADHWGR